MNKKTQISLGLTALSAALLFPGVASAQRSCDDLRGDVRAAGNNMERLRELQRQATSCPPVLAIIDDLIGKQEAPPADGTATRSQHSSAFQQATPTDGAGPRTPRSSALDTLVFNRPLVQRIAPSDPPLGERLRYDQYLLPLAADDMVEVTLRGEEITPIVAIGTGRLPSDLNVAAEDAFASADDHEARIVFVAPSDGEYVVVAASSETHGSYTLSARHLRPPEEPTATTIALDQAANGQLSAESPVLYAENGAPYELWAFQGHASERVSISMTAPEGSEVDPFLVVGRNRDGRFEEIERNDDQGPGTLNARVLFMPEADGEYLIRARAFSNRQLGAYNLAVRREVVLATAREEMDEDANAWVRHGVLSMDTAIDELGGFVNYEFRPRRAGRFQIQVDAQKFSPIVDVGRLGADDRVAEIDFYMPDESQRRPDEAVFEAARRGVYFVRVRARGGNGGGRFDLTITEAPVAAETPQPDAQPAEAVRPRASLLPRWLGRVAGYPALLFRVTSSHLLGGFGKAGEEL